MRADRRARKRGALYIAIFLAVLGWLVAVKGTRQTDQLRVSAQWTRGGLQSDPNSSEASPSIGQMPEGHDCDLVQIDDVSTRTEGLTVVIDLTMHNIGSRIATVTRLQLGEVQQNPSTKHHKDYELVLHSYLPATANYPMAWNEELTEISISHILRPDEADRIIVRVHLSASHAGRHISTQVTLKYNQSCRTPQKSLEFTAPGQKIESSQSPE